MEPIKTDDGQIVMVDPYGHTGGVPVDQMALLFTQGYRFATPDDNLEAYRQQEYGNQPVAAAAEGVARSATFGGYDVAANALGLDEGVRERRERNKGAATVGDIAGYALPGGAGKFLGKVGKGAAELAGLGEATGIGGRMLGGAVRGGAEGAAVGIQQTISDTALSEHPLSAEAIMSDLGSNMLYGGLTGGAIGTAGGAIGGIISEASSRVRARAQVVADRMAAEGEAQARIVPGAGQWAGSSPAAEKWASPDLAEQPRPAAHGPYARLGDNMAPEQGAIPSEPTPPAVEPTPDLAPLRSGGTAAEAPLRSGGTAAEPQVPETPIGGESYQPQGALGDTRASGPPAEFVPKIEAAYERAQLKVSDIEARLEKVYRRDTINDLGDTIQNQRRGPGRPRGAEDPHLDDLMKAHQRAVDNWVELKGQVEAIRAAPPAVEPTLRARPAEAAPEPMPAAPPPAPMSSRFGPEAGIFEGEKLADLQNYLRLQKDWWASHGGPDIEGGQSLTSARRGAGFENTGAHAQFEASINKKLDELGIGKGTPPPSAPGVEMPPQPPPGVVTPDMGQPTPGPEVAPRPAPPIDATPQPGGPDKNGAGFAGAAKKAAGGVGAHLAGALGWGVGAKLGHPFLVAGLARAAFRAVKAAVSGGAIGPAVTARVGQILQDFARGVDTVAGALPRAGAAARQPEPATSVLRRVTYAPAQAQATPPAQKGDGLSATFAKRAAELAQSANNLPATQARIHTLLLGLRAENPKAAAQVEQAAMAKLSFLWDKLPKNQGLGSPIDGFARGSLMSDAAVHDFARYAAAESPQRMMDELAAGRLSPQTVEATKAVYPETFNAVREELISRMSEMGKMPYSQRVQLSVLFEMPLDSTMRPETIAALQATFQNESGSPGGMKPPPGPANGPKSFSPPMPTKAQTLSG